VIVAVTPTVAAMTPTVAAVAPTVRAPGTPRRGLTGNSLTCSYAQNTTNVVACHYEYSRCVALTNSPTPVQTRALDAAIELVGDEGLRALTHARVDARAGLPKGSTSNYFRTRTALLTGVLDWIVEREMASVGPALVPRSVDDLVEAVAALIEYTTGPARVVTRARLVLFLEASHRPELQQSVSRGRVTMEASTVETLRMLGAADPEGAAAAVMACAEGIILHRIARGNTTDPRPALSLVLHAAVPGR
jgi:DNA-binding transcriptional regulator YbjK